MFVGDVYGAYAVSNRVKRKTLKLVVIKHPVRFTALARGRILKWFKIPKKGLCSNLTVFSCEPCPKRWFIWKLNKNKYGPEGLSAAAVRLLPLGVTNRTRMTLFGGGREGASLLNVSKQVVKHLTGRLKTSFMHFKSALSQSINIARTNRTERYNNTVTLPILFCKN